MKKFTILLAAFVLLAGAAQVRASDITARLQKRYESLAGFTTAFVQELTNASSGETSTRKGTIDFKRPRLIRWQTDSPTKELLVVNAHEVWDYFPEDGVAYVYGVDQIFSSKTMLRFISGEVRVEQDFDVETGCAEHGLVHLRLYAKNPEPGLVEAEIWINPKTDLLARIKIIDFFNNVNELAFQDTNIDPDLPATTFEFQPPKGVQVLDNR